MEHTVGVLPVFLAPIVDERWEGPVPLPWVTYDPEDYIAPPKVFWDGRTAWCMRMLFGARIALSLHPHAIEFIDEWAYNATGEQSAAEWRARAVLAFLRWDGRGEPVGWMKHPRTRRWRENGDPERESLSEFDR